MNRPTHAYIGTRRFCDCVVASVLDEADTLQGRRTTARCVSDMLIDGLIVSRVPLATVKLSNCTHFVTPEGQGMLPLGVKSEENA